MKKHASLFAGIGGFDLAAEWAGWENVFHCELNDFCQRILQYYWPEADHIKDITKEDFTRYANRIDVLTGGFPCQGFSLAGQRKGTEDDRYLWPEMRRAYNEIKPRVIVGENVTGILSMEDKSGVSREVFPKMESRSIVRYNEIDHYEAVYTRQAKMLVSNICKDLEEDGYEVQTFAIPAAGIGAPHRRERIYFLAHSDLYGHQSGGLRENRSAQKASEGERVQRERVWNDGWGNGEQGAITDPKGERRQQSGDTRQRRSGSQYGDSHTIRISTDPSSIRQQGPGRPLITSSTKEAQNWKASWSYNDGRWPTQSPVCSGDDGVPGRLDGITISNHRRESIKGYGNAIVPQPVYEMFKVIDSL